MHRTGEYARFSGVSPYRKSLHHQHGKKLNIPELEEDVGLKKTDDAFRALKEMERDHIIEALERSGFKVSGRGGAAELLGLKWRPGAKYFTPRGAIKLMVRMLDPACGILCHESDSAINVLFCQIVYDHGQ
ncbi:hypothetical protein QUF76_14100 [Desulfobacterales bacterium HSG16]|nr:hypothetical protein [Desulfobacterales bacterium HSG16]